jgi:hypothetical protein
METEKLLLKGVEGGRIIDNLGAPPQIIRILSRGIEDSNGLLKTVIFDAMIPDLVKTNSMGAFDPGEGIIFIDLGMCITQRSWMNKKGLLLIANVWFNLLFASLHELAHVDQLKEEPELIEFDNLPEEYEDEASAMAAVGMESYLEDHVIPPLNEMGWVGQELKDLYNKLYVSMPEAVFTELAIQGTNLVALAEDAARKDNESGRYDDEASIVRLLESIDEGRVGGRVDENRYLTAIEILHIKDHYNKAKEAVR